MIHSINFKIYFFVFSPKFSNRTSPINYLGFLVCNCKTFYFQLGVVFIFIFVFSNTSFGSPIDSISSSFQTKKVIKYETGGITLNQFLFDDVSHTNNFQLYQYNKLYFPTVGLPLEFNQNLYFNSKNEFRYDLSSFTLKFDSYFISDLLKQRIINANLNSPDYKHISIVKDSIRRFDMLRKELSDTIYQKNRTNCFNRVASIEDSLLKCFPIDTGLLHSLLSVQQKYLEKERNYQQLFEYKRSVNEVQLKAKQDSLDRIRDKVESMDQSQLRNEAVKMNVITSSEKFLASFRKIEIGKTSLNYSKLTAQNCLIKGVDIQNTFKNFFFAGAMGNQADYYNTLFPELFVSSNFYKLQMLSVGPGSLEKDHVHFSFLRFNSKNNSINNTSGLLPEGKILSVQILKKISQNSTIILETAQMMKPEKLAESVAIKTLDLNAVSIELQNNIKKISTKVIAGITQTGKSFMNPFVIPVICNDSRDVLIKTETEIIKSKLYFQSDHRIIKYNLTSTELSNTRSFYDLSYLIKYNTTKAFTIQSRYSKNITHYKDYLVNTNTDFDYDFFALDFFNYFTFSTIPVSSFISINTSRNRMGTLPSYNYDVNCFISESVSINEKFNFGFSSLLSSKVNTVINASTKDYSFALNGSWTINKRIYTDISIEFEKQAHQYSVIGVMPKVYFQVFKNAMLKFNLDHRKVLSNIDPLARGMWKMYSSLNYLF
jgi:hypothetical protein